MTPALSGFFRSTTTFQLSREPRHEPIERLIEATGADRVCLQDIGQEFHL